MKHQEKDTAFYEVALQGMVGRYVYATHNLHSWTTAQRPHFLCSSTMRPLPAKHPDAAVMCTKASPPSE